MAKKETEKELPNPPWLIALAIGLSIATSFLLWYSMDDFDRARIYSPLLGLPHTAAATAGILQIF